MTTAIKIDSVSKLYRLGTVGTGAMSPMDLIKELAL
jgi:hypothetical protein